MRNPFLTKASSYLIIGLVLVALFSGSCKKEDDEDDGGDPNQYMISFKANGVLEEFTSEHFPLGSIYNNGTQYTSLITGKRSTSSIGIEAMDKKAISEKMTYTGYAVTQATQTPAYVVGAVISYWEGQTLFITTHENPNVTVEITKITEKTLQGKFSGILKAKGKPDLVITEGKFIVPVGIRNN